MGEVGCVVASSFSQSSSSSSAQSNDCDLRISLTLSSFMLGSVDVGKVEERETFEGRGVQEGASSRESREGESVSSKEGGEEGEETGEGGEVGPKTGEEGEEEGSLVMSNNK